MVQMSKAKRGPQKLITAFVKERRRHALQSLKLPLDAALTGPDEIVQLKVVIALLISLINFSVHVGVRHNTRHVNPSAA